MARNEEYFKEALKGKKLPILTLDNKWHRLFTQNNQNPEVMQLAEEINELVAKQGGINNEIKEIRRLKTKLMDEIVSGMDGNTLNDKEMDDHKRLINECNEKIEERQDLLLDIPREIDRLNYQLMLYTMEVCYEAIETNTEEIVAIAEWIAQVRVDLKKNVIRKQEKEWLNQEMYSYMHDIFGPDVIEIFDMKYDPAGNMLKKTSDNPAKDEKNKDTKQ